MMARYMCPTVYERPKRKNTFVSKTFIRCPECVKYEKMIAEYLKHLEKCKMITIKAIKKRKLSGKD